MTHKLQHYYLPKVPKVFSFYLKLSSWKYSVKSMPKIRFFRQMAKYIFFPSNQRFSKKSYELISRKIVQMRKLLEIKVLLLLKVYFDAARLILLFL